MRMAVQLLPIVDSYQELQTVRVKTVFTTPFTVHFLSVQAQSLFAILDYISRQTDDSLDVAQGRFLRIPEHHHIPSRRFGRIDKFAMHDRQPNAVREFINKDVVAHQQRRNHRLGGDAKGLVENRTLQKYEEGRPDTDADKAIPARI